VLGHSDPLAFVSLRRREKRRAVCQGHLRGASGDSGWLVAVSRRGFCWKIVSVSCCLSLLRSDSLSKNFLKNLPARCLEECTAIAKSHRPNSPLHSALWSLAATALAHLGILVPLRHTRSLAPRPRKARLPLRLRGALPADRPDTPRLSIDAPGKFFRPLSTAPLGKLSFGFRRRFASAPGRLMRRFRVYIAAAPGFAVSAFSFASRLR
jgi:hypothetical protein